MASSSRADARALVVRSSPPPSSLPCQCARCTVPLISPLEAASFFFCETYMSVAYSLSTKEGLRLCAEARPRPSDLLLVNENGAFVVGPIPTEEEDGAEDEAKKKEDGARCGRASTSSPPLDDRENEMKGENAEEEKTKKKLEVVDVVDHVAFEGDDLSTYPTPPTSSCTTC